MASQMIGQTPHRLYHHWLNSSDTVSIATSQAGENSDNDVEMLGNHTIDVMQMGCSAHFNTVACVRSGLLCVLAVMTAISCLVKICRLHIHQHPTQHQYIIFYSATIQSVLCAVHWGLGLYTEFEFIIQWLKLLQFLLVSHLYWIIATRVTRKDCLTNSEGKAPKVSGICLDWAALIFHCWLWARARKTEVIGFQFPCLIVVTLLFIILLPLYMLSLLYFTIIVIFGCIHVKDSWVECIQPFWLALSSAELLLVQLFLVAAVYISKRLDEISTLGSVRRAQKRDLWLLVIVFEISAICGFGYDLTVRILASESSGCSGVFSHRQELYSPVFGSLTVIKLLLPVWTMLFVFHPIDSSAEHAELVLPANDNRNYTSVFSPPHDRHRYRPITYSRAAGGATEPEFQYEESTPALEQSMRTCSGGSTPTTPVFGPWQAREDPIQQEDFTVDVSQSKPMC